MLDQRDIAAATGMGNASGADPSVCSSSRPIPSNVCDAGASIARCLSVKGGLSVSERKWKHKHINMALLTSLCGFGDGYLASFASPSEEYPRPRRRCPETMRPIRLLHVEGVVFLPCDIRKETSSHHASPMALEEYRKAKVGVQVVHAELLSLNMP